MATIAPEEQSEIDEANASGKTPVIFIHGLWLLPSSWDNWAGVFADAGFAAFAPGWPDDPQTVDEAKAHPEVFANKSLDDVADHYTAVIEALDKKPAVIGHSFGGLLAQMLAGRGLSAATVAVDAAPFRGVLPLPISALRAAKPALANPRNKHRAVPLTFDQFHYAFANAVSEDEAKELFETYAVPAPGEPLFEAAFANLNPWTEAKVDHENVERGPVAHHLGREGPHGSPRHFRGGVQEAEEESRRDRVRLDPRPGPRPDDRQRLARGGRHGPHLRPALRLLSSRAPAGRTHKAGEARDRGSSRQGSSAGVRSPATSACGEWRLAMMDGVTGPALPRPPVSAATRGRARPAGGTVGHCAGTGFLRDRVPVPGGRLRVPHGRVDRAARHHRHRRRGSGSRCCWRSGRRRSRTD